MIYRRRKSLSCRFYFAINFIVYLDIDTSRDTVIACVCSAIAFNGD